MLITRHSKNRNEPIVRRAQEALIQLGYNLGPWGADSIFGDDTAAAVAQFQMAHGLNPSGALDDETWKCLCKMLKMIPVRTTESSVAGIVYPFRFVDMRGDKHKSSLFRPGRELYPVGVTLHQTGMIFNENNALISATNAHFVVSQYGTVFIIHRFGVDDGGAEFVWHAQGLSHLTLGIEFEANDYGLEGNKYTFWKDGGGPYPITEKQAQAGIELIGYLATEYRKKGVDFNYCQAHRQASKNKPICPGQRIWREVAIPAMKKNNLTDGGPDYTLGTGKPIPVEWNSEYKHGFWE